MCWQSSRCVFNKLCFYLSRNLTGPAAAALRRGRRCIVSPCRDNTSRRRVTCVVSVLASISATWKRQKQAEREVSCRNVSAACGGQKADGRSVWTADSSLVAETWRLMSQKWWGGNKMEDGGEDLFNRKETTDGTKSENTTGENLKQIRLKILI